MAKKVKLIRIHEAAERLGLTAQTLRNWAAKGVFDIIYVDKVQYVDENFINGITSQAQDTQKAIKRLEDIKKRVDDERIELSDFLYDAVNMRRYSGFCVTKALEKGLFDAVLKMLYDYNVISDIEYETARRRLNGYQLEDIAKDLGVTRERVRQRVEMVIRKSGKIEEIRNDIRRITQLEAENKALKRLLAKNSEEKKEDSPDKELTDLLSTKICDTRLSVRAITCLRAGCNIVPPCKTIGDVCRLQMTDLLKIRNLGKKTLWEIRDFLDDFGLTFNMNVDEVYKKALL